MTLGEFLKLSGPLSSIWKMRLFANAQQTPLQDDILLRIFRDEVTEVQTG